MYITPRFIGFQAGFSYTPENGDEGQGVVPKKNPSNYSDFLEFGINYTGDFSGVTVAAGATGTSANGKGTGITGRLGAEGLHGLAGWCAGRLCRLQVRRRLCRCRQLLRPGSHQQRRPACLERRRHLHHWPAHRWRPIWTPKATRPPPAPMPAHYGYQLMASAAPTSSPRASASVRPDVLRRRPEEQRRRDPKVGNDGYVWLVSTQLDF